MKENDKVIDLLVEYRSLLYQIDSIALSEKINTIDKVIENFKKKKTNSDKLNTSQLKEEIECISNIYKSECNQTCEGLSLVATKYSNLLPLFENNLDILDFLQQQNIIQLNLKELKVIYYILFQEHTSKNKKEIIEGINNSLSRRGYYNSFKSV